MSNRFENRAAVAVKVEWEGGVLEALDYGIKTADMPGDDKELAEAWAKLEAAFKVIQPLAEMVEGMLEDFFADGDEG